ncbi:MAG: hypothetical protein ACK5Q5_09205 [Planctomycetaceae bacterium]
MKSEHSQSASFECSPALWEAVCYLAGELSTVEADAFEERLADDIELADALASAVRLTTAVAETAVAVPARTSSVPGTAVDVTPVLRQSDRRGRMVVAAVCGALLALVAWSASSHRESQAVPAEPSRLASDSKTEVQGAVDAVTQNLESVLSVWVELNQSREVLPDDSALDTLLVDASADVPDWMFAALQTASIGSGAESLPVEADGAQEGAL